MKKFDWKDVTVGVSAILPSCYVGMLCDLCKKNGKSITQGRIKKINRKTKTITIGR